MKKLLATIMVLYATVALGGVTLMKDDNTNCTQRVNFINRTNEYYGKVLNVTSGYVDVCANVPSGIVNRAAMTGYVGGVEARIGSNETSIANGAARISSNEQGIAVIEGGTNNYAKQDTHNDFLSTNTFYGNMLFRKTLAEWVGASGIPSPAMKFQAYSMGDVRTSEIFADAVDAAGPGWLSFWQDDVESFRMHGDSNVSLRPLYAPTNSGGYFEGNGAGLTNQAWSLAAFVQTPEHGTPTNFICLGKITGDNLATNIEASLQAGTCVLHVASTILGQHWYSGTRLTNYATITVTPTLANYATFLEGTLANGVDAMLIVTNQVDAFGLSLTIQGKTLVAP